MNGSNALRADRPALPGGGGGVMPRRSWLALAFLTLSAVGCSTSETTTSTASRQPDALVVAAISAESRIRETEFNLSRMEYWARRAAGAGADLALFPEAGISAWWQSREVRAFGEPVDGPSIRRLVGLAEELGIILAVGMTETDGDCAYITHVLLDGNGVIGRHRKSALAGGADGEGRVWDAGHDADVFDVRGFRIGIAICYESVEPDTCRALRANGAEIILAPYANGTDPRELLTGRRPYTFARARENGVWYVACDAPPHDEDGSLRPGAAYVINPEGELVALTPPDARGETMVLYTIPALPRRHDGRGK